MKIIDKLYPILHLIRFPNLIIIILTQFLLRYGILIPVLYPDTPEMISGIYDFFLLVLVTVLIAAGGYIINDYFDVSIDEINKPGKNMVGKRISEKSSRRVHLVFTGIAVLIGFYLAYRLKSMTFGLVFPFISILLWFYSAKYKRSLLSGNIIVSILSVLVIFIVWYFEFLHLQVDPERFVAVMENMKVTTRLFLAYGLFAFLVSLIREIIKDMEDIEGDRQNGCRTLPVVAGIKQSRYVVGFLILIVFILICYSGWIAFNLVEIWIFYYLLGVIGIPLIYLFVKVFKAGSQEDFHFLSGLCKLIMVAGVLSLQLVAVAN